jgi:hypothetical protein
MEELYKQALSLIEDDAHWLDDAGQHCEDLASELSVWAHLLGESPE